MLMILIATVIRKRIENASAAVLFAPLLVCGILRPLSCGLRLSAGFL